MSSRALLLATAAHLQTQLSLDNSVCDVHLDGQPPAVAGQRYVAVHPGDWFVNEGDYDLDETFGLKVTVTFRSPVAPEDRMDDALVFNLDATAMIELVENVRVKIHRNEAIRAAANVIIGAGENGFITPLRLMGKVVGPTEVGSSWFFADPGEPKAGITYVLTFGDARRVQVISEMS